MAKAVYYMKGDSIDFTNTNAEAIGYHDVLVLGSIIGVAEEEIENGQVGSVAIAGTFQLPTDAVDITVGMPVYWDATAEKAVKENSGTLILAGVAVAPTASGLVPVKLNVLATAPAAAPKTE